MSGFTNNDGSMSVGGLLPSGVGEALQERLLGSEVVGGEPAAVPGPLADARQRQRVHPLLDDQFGGGVEQGGFGLIAALLLGAADGCHGHQASILVG